MSQIPLEQLEQILPLVSKPARYLGNEHNAVKKDFQSYQLKFALCFPDTYEIGMSNLGFKILYHLLNSQPEIICERVFAPWIDMENIMRQKGMPIFSLESRRTLDEFDIIGFSLQYEMNYSNVLTILSLAGIPFLSAERNERFPLVIAGGVCAFNPEPIADFFDAFFIGEAEEGILEIISNIKYQISKSSRINPEISGLSGQIKNQILKELAKIEGIYVPSLYEVSYNESGTIKSFTPKIDAAPNIIKKRIVKDFKDAYYPTNQIVPYIQIVHDRISLEVMRGCPNRCYFCQSTSNYWPSRSRGTERILQLAEETYKATGYEEISLVSLSTGDHPQIIEIVQHLVSRFKKRGVSISLPSLRAEDVLHQLPKLVSSIKKTGLTFAPEAGTARLRSSLNKRFNVEDLFKCVTEAARAGWRHVKLYFMVGLPKETEEDLFAIAELAKKISRPDKVINKPAISVTISVSSFVPRPHTPFENEPMEDIDALQRKFSLLHDITGGKGLTLKRHNTRLGFLEGVFSRGDRRLGKVIIKAWEQGVRFDSWTDCFNFDIWMQAFASSNIEPSFYIYRKRAPDEILPWAFVDCGFEKSLLA